MANSYDVIPFNYYTSIIKEEKVYNNKPKMEILA